MVLCKDNRHSLRIHVGLGSSCELPSNIAPVRPTHEHAIVIGASIAGLSAARVLADHYQQVTVFDRDELPQGPQNRSAIPQGRHVHLLLARGVQELDSLFPGLGDDLVEAGVAKLSNRPDCIHFGAAGHVLGTGDELQKNFTTYVPSRPQLEYQIRRRVRDLPNVEFRSEAVAAPRYDAARQSVTGVLLDANDESSAVAADLVVDATGRGTRLPAWLEQWGYDRPREDTVDVGIGYATQRLRVPDGLLEEKKVIVAGASREQPIGLGMLYYEDGTWGLTMFGIAKIEPPATFAEMCDRCDEVLPADFAKAIRQGEPIGDVVFHKYPTSRWRRYDKLDRFPAGILPLGDSVVSFNPTYGQGMTMSLVQATALRSVLQSSDPDFAAKLTKVTAKNTWPVWMMDAIGDQVLHRAPGPKPRWYEPVGNLFDQFLTAAEGEPVLAEWFLRRFSLLDSLYMVPPPRLIARTMRYNFRCWRAERKAARLPQEDYAVSARSKSGSM